MLLTSISFLMRCISPFVPDSSDAFESDGEDRVAAIRAAIAAFSSGGRRVEDSPCESLSHDFSPFSIDANRSLRNWGVSMSCNLTSGMRDETDLMPSEAESVRSVAWREDIQAVDLFRSSIATR